MVSLTVGERQVFRNVTLFPLFRTGGRDRPTSGRGESGDWSLRPPERIRGRVRKHHAEITDLVARLDLVWEADTHTLTP